MAKTWPTPEHFTSPNHSHRAAYLRGCSGPFQLTKGVAVPKGPQGRATVVLTGAEVSSVASCHAASGKSWGGANLAWFPSFECVLARSLLIRSRVVHLRGRPAGALFGVYSLSQIVAAFISEDTEDSIIPSILCPEYS